MSFSEALSIPANNEQNPFTADIRVWRDTLQVNRAIRYILYARSRTAGTLGGSPEEGGRTQGGRSEQGQRRKAAMVKQRATKRIQA